MKRTITPHKGNRSEHLHLRATPETVAHINAILAHRNQHRNQHSDGKVSFADWVAEYAAQEFATITEQPR